MKCLNCGSVNSPSRLHCSQCSAPLTRDQKTNQGTDSASDNLVRRDSEVPEWRREVSAKARAYGERRKRLTTPPHAWKEPEKAAPESPSVPASHKSDVAADNPLPPIVTRAPIPVPPSPPVVSGNLEAWDEDVHREDVSAQDDMTSSPFLLRRSLSLIVDTTIVVVMVALLMAILSWTSGKTFSSFLGNEWKIWIPGSLLIHCLYYTYFYKASRQTPGLVFVALEIRDPGGSDIPLHKILLRWLFMVLLNVLNLLPVVTGRKSLLLDVLSGTNVRSLK